MIQKDDTRTPDTTKWINRHADGTYWIHETIEGPTVAGPFSCYWEAHQARQKGVNDETDN